MTATLSHRGPDGVGYHCDGPVALDRWGTVAGVGIPSVSMICFELPRTCAGMGLHADSQRRSCPVPWSFDGRLDQEPELLAELDVVVASVHSKLRMDGKEMTRRMVSALANPHMDILGHCTGRIVVGRGRPESDFDPEMVFAAALRFDKAVEILRIDPAFLGVADLAQPVLVLRLEIERGHVVEHERDVPAGHHVAEAQPGETVPVVPIEAAAQRALARGQARRDPAHLCQHPVHIQQAGRLDHPGDHQVTEHLITQRVEPEIRIHPGQHVIQQARRRLQRPRPRHHSPGTRCRLAAEQHRLSRGRDHRDPPGLRSDPEIENALDNPEDFKSALQERLARRGDLVSYTVIEERGPPHQRTFAIAATIRGIEIARGVGRSKKDAEQEAAQAALGALEL